MHSDPAHKVEDGGTGKRKRPVCNGCMKNDFLLTSPSATEARTGIGCCGQVVLQHYQCVYKYLYKEKSPKHWKL